MAENQNKDQEDPKSKEADNNQDAPKSKKKLIIIAIPVVLLLVGAVAFFLLKPSEQEPSSSTEETATTEEGSEQASAETAASKEETATTNTQASKEKSSLLDKITGKNKSDFGETINLKPFNINLGNPLENRYVRLEIALEYKGKEAQKKEIERRMPQLRDAIISVTSKRSREALLSPDGKDQLRKELLIIINRYMDNPIESVYITDILID